MKKVCVRLRKSAVNKKNSYGIAGRNIAKIDLIFSFFSKLSAIYRGPTLPLSSGICTWNVGSASY
jgi:hypothetical protein